MGNLCGSSVVTVDKETLKTLSRNNPQFLLPDTEKNFIVQVEDGIPFHKIDYDQFNLTLKKYGLQSKIDQQVLPFITSQLKVNFPFDQRESPQYRLVYNKHIIDENDQFIAERLQLLALMRCKHANIDSRYTRFWEFINPTFEEEIPAGDVMDLIKEMSILALPVLQEAFGGEDANQDELYPGVLRYLKTMED